MLKNEALLIRWPEFHVPLLSYSGIRTCTDLSQISLFRVQTPDNNTHDLVLP